MHWIVRTGLLGLSFAGFSSSLYVLLKDDEDEPEYKPGPIYSVKSTVVEIKVPRAKVGAILGSSGNSIKKLEEDTNTKIFIKDSISPEVKICVIRGGTANVVNAQKCIYDKIINYPIEETLEIFLPMRNCRTLLARRGEEMQRIERNTQTKITVDNWCFHNNYSTRKVHIRGYPHQIERAKSQLVQIIDDDEEATPFTPNGLIPRLTQIAYGNEEEDDDLLIPMEEVFRTGDNGLLEVYIASIESPQKFWVQIMGPGVLSVDRLADDMTEFYEKETTQRSHQLHELKPGMVIAIPHNSDQRYYRAEIRNVYPDYSDDDETVLEVFYLDFGDVGRYKRKGAFELDKKFLKMRFQAIECSLANIKEKKVWPAEAVEMFINLTCTGAWNTMSARIIKYICPPASQKKSSPIPCLQLIDTTHNIYTDVNYELVRCGFAEWVDDFEFRE